MNRIIAFVVLAGVIAGPAFSYTRPTDEQIEQIVGNHTQLNVVVQDATPTETASVLARAIQNVQESTLTPEGKAQAIALLNTRALLLSGEKAPQMASKLAGKLDKKQVLPVVAASTAITVGGTEGPVINSIAQAAGTDTAAIDALAAAVTDPASVLGADTVALVQQLVIEMRGAAAAAIPPPSTAPLRVIPPIVVPGAIAPAPPPPPEAPRYTGQ